ncbi:hypothetical protein N5C60_14730 [Pseudomonas mosselii]|uniref:hypothetical protein n=1 Tax=Pseudomonas mosselii TaxID=78327 RepID=UPI00242BE3DF|nr:hypothetical protein [Pseudomonas mosselii]MDH1145860.1 hypothetical protein [Pseudomonas mosselii]
MINPSGQQKALWCEHYNAVRQARNQRNGCLNTPCRRRQASTTPLRAMTRPLMLMATSRLSRSSRLASRRCQSQLYSSLNKQRPNRCVCDYLAVRRFAWALWGAFGVLIITLCVFAASLREGYALLTLAFVPVDIADLAVLLVT